MDAGVGSPAFFDQVIGGGSNADSEPVYLGR